MVVFHPGKKVIFIHIPKCAGLTLETILVKQFGFERFSFEGTTDNYPFLRDPRGKLGILRYLLKYSKEAKIYDLASFKRIAVIRNPYERCESGIRYLHKNSVDKYKFPMNLREFYYTALDKHYFYMHFCLTMKRSLEDLDGNINMAYLCRFDHLFEDMSYALFNVCGFPREEIRQIHVNKSDKEVLSLNSSEIRLLITRLHAEDFEEFGYEIDNVDPQILDSVLNINS